MLILLDENLPQRLRLLIPSHDIHTTTFQGWSGLTNGALPRTAEAAGFEILSTADRGIQHQQNREGLRLAILVLITNELRVAKAAVDKVSVALDNILPGTLAFVDLGE